MNPQYMFLVYIVLANIIFFIPLKAMGDTVRIVALYSFLISANIWLAAGEIIDQIIKSQ